MDYSGFINEFNGILKKSITLLLGAVCVLSLTTSVACTNAKKVEDYPESEIETPAENEDPEVSEVEIRDDSEDDLTELLSEFDSLKERGSYTYNPVIVHPVYKQEIKNNPKIIRAAKIILQAVYDCETEFTLSGEDECSQDEFNLANNLAQFSSPMSSAVTIERIDEENYSIIYFPTYVSDNDGNSADAGVSNPYGYKIEGGVSPEEAAKRFAEYEDYVTEIINRNLTDKDDSMQRAAKIYKALIEDLELDYGDEEDSTEEVDPAANYLMTINTTSIDIFNSKKLTPTRFVELYQYIMVQLNVDCIVIGANGQYQEQPFETLNSMLSNPQAGWLWPIITVGENSYNCDIMMDKVALDDQRKSFEEYESDLLYFGMSDKKREESYISSFKIPLQSLNPMKQQGIPECKEDYKQ
ncbi:MAG: hypothetical protein K6G75_10590 [Lachnospiraceae bacterium]|nr:hypothetical protein [Lachnospiraceae bacterium]